MRLDVVVEVRARRGGIEAHAPSLSLSGHGEDAEAAVSCLKRGVEAWANALLRSGELERALNRRRVPYSESSGQEIEVELTIPETMMAG